MKLKDKKVLVFGAGKSGISAARLLQKLEAYVVLYDGKKDVDTGTFKDKIDTSKNWEAYFGEFPMDKLDQIDLMIISPGIAIDHPFVEAVKEKAIPIWGEIELAYRHSKGKIIAVTGTNGKTTTTSLIGEIMNTYFKQVFVVGNIGNPYTDIALDTTEDSVTIIELSSFQLETIHEFCPDVSAILNITPDHLNRHHTMENYINLKKSIAKNQSIKNLCVLNYEDVHTRKIGNELDTRIVYFSSETKLDNGLYLDGDDIIYSKEEIKEKICNVNELQILGKHSYENVMAAVAVAIEMGIPMDLIYQAIRSFKAVEHRIEYVDTINGVSYYNDSKGTNPDASIKAVMAMKKPTILIGGGYDKGSSFDEWILSFKGKVKTLVLMGETKEKIAATAKKYNFNNIIMVEDLKEAVLVSAREAKEGDVVLLSPACASWGMFDNYEQRGRMFKKYVKELL
ncbi:UDP-N-acetylmuramoyl-L-alanine--D-glutamate ligase [Herbinix luporum]|uniref:UDP-N-acetylmuramoylalanine--D-glutamate ligase n=1 Tax=Herbinix luporum TaxID=1679721 RepID=A0A0K8J3Y7_9FIRM|nr:UDP-N-acetylmuramoyl-L-alanine--D-glutamate ligase [Herbinix luporum]CUH92366.1 UDP-N-acetylmuramoylalanine-D-glutamate ligase [Herbinix luporum]HHT58033.1 UDP-N-acetylmuramoyl-L-alanine--D-glutamate ligase [Herbinix luporum]